MHYGKRIAVVGILALALSLWELHSAQGSSLSSLGRATRVEQAEPVPAAPLHGHWSGAQGVPMERVSWCALFSAAAR